MAWTDERVAVLLELWHEGFSASKIAEALGEGATRASVICKIHRLGEAIREKGDLKEGLGPITIPEPSLKPVLPALPRPPEPKEPAHTLSRVVRGQCRWPLDRPGPAMAVCGAHCSPGRPYCAVHMKRAYRPVPPLVVLSRKAA